MAISYRAGLSLCLILVFCPLASPNTENPLMQMRSRIVAEAFTKLKRPYSWGATGPNRFDCSGFVAWVYRRHGIDLPRTAREQFVHSDVIDTPAPGDIVFFSTYRRGASHCGIYIAGGKFIHASKPGVKVSSLTDPYYKKRFLGATAPIVRRNATTYFATGD